MASRVSALAGAGLENVMNHTRNTLEGTLTKERPVAAYNLVF